MPYAEGGGVGGVQLNAQCWLIGNALQTDVIATWLAAPRSQEAVGPIQTLCIPLLEPPMVFWRVA